MVGWVELRVLTCPTINNAIFVSDLIIALFLYSFLGYHSDGRSWMLA